MEQTHFYKFIEPFNEELAFVARDLEKSIYVSPRTFIETLLATVMQNEKI